MPAVCIHLDNPGSSYTYLVWRHAAGDLRPVYLFYRGFFLHAGCLIGKYDTAAEFTDSRPDCVYIGEPAFCHTGQQILG